MALTINGTGNGKINNTSFSTTTGNAVTTGDSGTVTEGMLSSTYYEEGTWTATFFSGNFGTGTNLGSSTANTYTRIGNVVTIVWERSSSGSTANTLSFTGVPFNFVDGYASGPTSDGKFMFSDGANLNSVTFRSTEGQYARGTLTYRIT